MRGFAVLRERDFRLLFSGHLISQLGDGMVSVALSFAVLDLTGSVADLGYVTAARVAPLVAFLLVGGVVADRLSRRVVMVGADLVRMASQGASAGLLLSGHAHVWELALLQACYGAATAFFNPAATGLVPSVVSAERLQSANALRGLAQGGAGIAGPALAALLVTSVGPGWALAADAASFLVSAGCLTGLRLGPQQHARVQSFVRDLREGWAEFSSRSWVWATVIFAGLGNMLAGGFFVLGAAISKQQLGGAGAWGLILACFAAGGVIGGLLVLRLAPRRPLRLGTIALLPWAGPCAMLALGAPAWLVAAAGLVSGAGLMMFNALWETTLQRLVPPGALSRVSAYDYFGSLIMQPLGFALVGPEVAAFGQTATLWIVAAGMFATTALMLAVPSVRALRVEPAQPPQTGAATAPALSR
jgi:hypothetical protein